MNDAATSHVPDIPDSGTDDPPDSGDVADRPIARWWTRTYLDRQLSPLERRFLDEAARMLDDLAPRQVDPALCAVTAAGPSTLIALVPHRCLGGLTLAVTVTAEFVTVSWASIHDLASHDDLDLSREVYLFGRDGGEETMCTAAVDGLRDQLRRRFTLRVRSTPAGIPLTASCHLAGADGRLRRIASLPPRMSRARRWWRWARSSDRDISFVDVSPPPYAVPSRASAWFRT